MNHKTYSNNQVSKLSGDNYSVSAHICTTSKPPGKPANNINEEIKHATMFILAATVADY